MQIRKGSLAALLNPFGAAWANMRRAKASGLVKESNLNGDGLTLGGGWGAALKGHCVQLKHTATAAGCTTPYTSYVYLCRPANGARPCLSRPPPLIPLCAGLLIIKKDGSVAYSHAGEEEEEEKDQAVLLRQLLPSVCLPDFHNPCSLPSLAEKTFGDHASVEEVLAAAEAAAK